jgi:hypothetical protein
MGLTTEKNEMQHVENASSSHDSNAIGERGFVGETNELPKGYFYSPFFVGTTVAVGFNLMVKDTISIAL